MAADDDTDPLGAPDDDDATAVDPAEPAESGERAGDAEDDTGSTLTGTESPEPRRRRVLGPGLLLLGGGVWALTAVMRCAGPPPTDALAVSPDAADAADDSDGEARPAVADDDGAFSEPSQVRSEDEPAPVPAAEAAAQPDDDDDEMPPEEELPPPSWLDDLEPPDVVHYVVRRGGSMKNVANLFKIHHHEIQALNPGVDLEAELAPGTKLVVYRRKNGTSSESIGFPSGGSLEGGVPMLAGPGRELKAIPWKSWGTASTVVTLDRILRQWSARGSVQPILVGNMSARGGGKLEPHSTHQSGRDVDLGYPQKLPKGEELNWREMNADNLDAEETWSLLRLLRESGKVEVVFIDRGIQKLLHDHAVKQGMSKGKLKRWMEYPRSGTVASAFIQHVPGHTDHLHVRFFCSPGEGRCKSK
jgi:murein endopeptidase